MTSCYPSTFENGTDTRVYIDSNVMTVQGQAAAPTWIKIGGETASKISIKPKTAEATNKDSTGGMTLPVGYDWSMTADANWDLDDAGQVLIRGMAMALVLRRIAWRPSGSTVGYYGYASVGWDGDATQRAVTKFSITIDGCGDIVYA
jgi:hypothetical protein